MTIAEAKNKLIAWANGQIGYVESGDNWNKYAQGLQSAYGWNVQSQPWCDIFTDAGFISCFGLENAAKMTYQPVGAFSALCRQSAQYFKNNGAWFSYPEPGDIIFLIYDGGINHQGIVTKVSGGVVSTVEGNSSDRVRSGAYATGSSAIAGYGRPKWSVVETTANSSEKPNSSGQKKCTVTVTLPVLEKGDKGEYVKMMQQRLIAKGYSCGIWGADGDFGNGTSAALKKFQKDKGLDQDAVCGPQSWKALVE